MRSVRPRLVTGRWSHPRDRLTRRPRPDLRRVRLVRIRGVSPGPARPEDDALMRGRGAAIDGTRRPTQRRPLQWKGTRTMAIYPEWVTADGGQAAPAGPAGTSADAGDPRADAADAANAAGEVDAAAAANATSDTVEVAATPIAIDDAPVPPPTGWNDPLTGTDGPHYWDRLIISESARVRRYKRPTTIVFVEVAGLDPARPAVGPGRRRADARQRGADALAVDPHERPHRPDRADPVRDPAHRDRRDRGDQLHRAGPGRVRARPPRRVRGRRGRVRLGQPAQEQRPGRRGRAGPEAPRSGAERALAPGQSRRVNRGRAGARGPASRRCGRRSRRPARR